jgi:hypothetical protein
VDDRGRRRDGGAGFTIAFNRCGGKDEGRETGNSSWSIKPEILPFNHLADALGVFGNILSKLSSALWSNPRRRFSLA